MDGNCSYSDSQNMTDRVQSDSNNSYNDSHEDTSLTSAQDANISSMVTSRNSSWCDSQTSLLSETSDVNASHRPIRVVVSGRHQPAPQSSPPPWHEEYSRRPRDLPSARQTVRRDNRLLTGASLPVFSAPNCRSIGPKLNNIIEDMKLRSISCILASESWQKESSKKCQKEVERLIEMEGMKMISKPRKYRRGGGVCIIADISKVSISHLDIPSGNLEIVWALLKPKEESIIKEIITFAFYLPPRSKMKSKMNDHIVTTLHQLLTVFPRAGIMGGGDRNDWCVNQILPAIPRFQNLQHLPTLNGKNLDVFLSNLGSFYSKPVVVPAIEPDNPSRGKRSDHSVPIIYPLDNNNMKKSKDYKLRTTRPLPDSGVRRFGQALMEEDWEEVRQEESPTQQDEALQAVLARLLEDSLPTKTVKLRHTDKPYITKEIKVIDRRRRREYEKHGKSIKYLQMKTTYDRKLKAATQNYLNKNVRDLLETQPGKAYGVLKRLGAQPGETVDAGSFELPEHVSLGLTAQQSADRIAQKFADISQEYPAINLESLDTRVAQSIQNSKNEQKPYISEKLVASKIEKAKNTKGGVEGDLPVKLSKQFSQEIAVPAAKIFNNIVNTGEWPSRWKIEKGIPLNKVKPKMPESESELRIISLTPFLSKTFERIVYDWLIHFIGNKMDWNQYGGTKGSSSSHYIIDMITYILYNQDLKEPKAVLTAMVDFEKAFNRQNHIKLLTKLHNMGTPGWLLNIIKGFLQDRSLVVCYKGEESGRKEMPGGSPQGTILGLFLFLVQINDAGYEEINRELGTRITKAINRRKEIDSKHWKYVDDLTIAEAIDLKRVLLHDDKMTKPLEYHNRTEQILPKEGSKVYAQLEELIKYSADNEMKINKEKTKFMLFNTARKRDFTPKFNIGGTDIETVEQLKLLGVQITNDLKWNANTEYISFTLRS